MPRGNFSRVSHVSTHLDRKDALSVPQNPGRKGLYKTILGSGSRTCRGRPVLGGQLFVLGTEDRCDFSLLTWFSIASRLLVW